MPTGPETSVMGLAMPVPNSDTTVIVAKIKSFIVLDLRLTRYNY